MSASRHPGSALPSSPVVGLPTCALGGGGRALQQLVCWPYHFAPSATGGRGAHLLAPAPVSHALQSERPWKRTTRRSGRTFVQHALLNPGARNGPSLVEPLVQDFVRGGG
jgi:hypothetical protein